MVIRRIVPNTADIRPANNGGRSSVGAEKIGKSTERERDIRAGNEFYDNDDLREKKKQVMLTGDKYGKYGGNRLTEKSSSYDEDSLVNDLHTIGQQMKNDLGVWEREEAVGRYFSRDREAREEQLKPEEKSKLNTKNEENNYLKGEPTIDYGIDFTAPESTAVSEGEKSLAKREAFEKSISLEEGNDFKSQQLEDGDGVVEKELPVSEKGGYDQQTGAENYSGAENYFGGLNSSWGKAGIEKERVIPSFQFGNFRLEEKQGFWRKFGGRRLAYGMAVLLLLVVGGTFSAFALGTKNRVEKRGRQALNYLEKAKADLLAGDFESAQNNLAVAEESFAKAEKETDKLGGQLLDALVYVPYLSKVSTGRNVIVLGDNLTKALGELAEISKLMKGVKNPLDRSIKEQPSLTDILLVVQERIVSARDYLERAEKAGEKVKIEDLPSQYRGKMRKVKEILPLVKNSLDDFNRTAKVFLELLGHNGPRKYLIVFENNQEMRATGGFIGSYGLLQTNKGRVENLKIEGIYNPDGQLKVNVVPPRPIQKISAAWSTHDANWWPDFPKSARKIAWFYEKTGGPTTDGVIAMTPVVLEKLLEVTGPIEMPEYNKIVTSKNFVEIIQSEVERDFKQRNEKEKNKKSDENIKREKSLETRLAIENKNKENGEVVKDPKKILADLAPKLLGRVFNVDGLQRSGKVLQALLTSLREKHILLYFNEPTAQKIVSEQGWSGEVLQTDKDYLMVVNTNINGFKTDGVIDESIKEEVNIGSDGRIIDTLTVVRRHRGGQTKYDWWNKVNADYLRVYIPQGSKLLSASGYTREVNEERLDYDRLGFQVDKDVEKEERYMKIDPETGTRIYNENGKTVLANWVYVSPGETVTLVYKYELPFKLDWQKGVARYSLLAQKQSGSIGSDLEVIVKLPKNAQVTWWRPATARVREDENLFSWRTDLREDRFLGLVLKEKGFEKE